MISDPLVAALPLGVGVRKNNPIDPIVSAKTTEMRFMAYEDLRSARLICAHLGKQGEWRFHQVETNRRHLLHLSVEIDLH